MSKKLKQLAKGLFRRPTQGQEDELFQGSSSSSSRRKAIMEAFQRDEVMITMFSLNAYNCSLF